MIGRTAWHFVVIQKLMAGERILTNCPLIPTPNGAEMLLQKVPSDK